MTPGIRKFFLTIHVTVSVGWFGAVAVFLALSIAGITGKDAQVARSLYVAMRLITWFVIIPLSFASLSTGLIQSLGTRWGLFRHYWILIKFILVSLSIIVLLIHLQPISFMADKAVSSALFDEEVRAAQFQLVIAPVAALLVFIVAIALAVYKPKGMTRYGLRKYKP